MIFTDPSSAASRLLAPGVFVLLWASGYVVARYAAPHAAPLSFLALRFALTAAVLLPWALWAGARWPRGAQLVHIGLAGLLIHAVYLGGIWVAIARGMPSGLAALIVNLQPIITAVAGVWLGERLGARGWAGLALGFAGVALVVADRSAGGEVGVVGVALATLALLAITIGTLYQKRYAPSFDLRVGTAVQNLCSLVFMLPLALAFEVDPFRWSAELVLAMTWAVLALSIGGVFLMYMLIARGAATRVTSLFYLVPPVTASLAWLMFREPFGWQAAFGMLLTAIGVALVHTDHERTLSRQ